MRALLVMAALTLASCRGPATGAAMGAAIGEGEAAGIAAAAEASFTGGDSRAIMAHYAPDAVVFDPGTNAPSRDRAVQTRWTDALVALAPTNFKLLKRTIQTLGPDAFISSGIAALDVRTAQGAQTVHVRFTDVFQKQADGKWLIVHEHNSALPAPAAPL